MDVRAALKEAIARLGAASVPSHTLAAELLLMHTLDRDRAWLYAHAEELLDPTSAERFFALVQQRAGGTPTQYLTRRQEFWGLEFEVTPDVLIPRPETEHVVEVALERLGERGAREALRIADVGTGSGCLAVALARELPRATLFATDISGAALDIARRNAARHGVAHRVHFLRGNLLDVFLQGSRDTGHQSRLLDLIVSNPPYVGRGEAPLLPREVREHEPEEALFAGETGWEVYDALIPQSANLLASGGVLVLELGYNWLDRVRPLLDSKAGWHRVGVSDDLAGIPRVLAAEKL